MINELNRRNRSHDFSCRSYASATCSHRFSGGNAFWVSHSWPFSLVAVAGTVYLSNIYKCSMEVLVNRERLDPTVTSEATNQMPTMTPPVKRRRHQL